MTDYTGSGGSGTGLKLTVTHSTSASGNYHDVRLRFYAKNSQGAYQGNPPGVYAYVQLDDSRRGSQVGFDSSDYQLLKDETWRVNANADGYAGSVRVYGHVNGIGGSSSFTGGTVSATYSLPRIPKDPGAPRNLSISNIDTDSAIASFSAPADDGGAPIAQYSTRLATNSSMSGFTDYFSSGSPRTLTGLAAATQYWAQTVAKNTQYPYYGSPSATVPFSTLPNRVTGLVTSSVDPSALTLGWNAPSGNAVTGYEVRQSTVEDFSQQVTTVTTSARSYRFTGLTPGQRYFYDVRAKTVGGYGARSSVLSIRPGLPAPTITSVATNTANWRLRVTWTPPSVVEGLAGYRILAARTPDMVNAVPFDVGNVTSADVALTGGRLYYVQVSALTAGSRTNDWSNVAAGVLRLSSGDVDNWGRTRDPGTALDYYTTSGVRRATLNGSPALYVETLATGPAVLGGDSYGLERVVDGLTPGNAYRFAAQATAAYPSPPTPGVQGRTYRLEVENLYGASITLEAGNSTATLPYVDIVASGSSVTIRIMLDESLVVPGPLDRVESVAFHDITVTELATSYPTRLRDTVYESNLANHFDLACNSVGASWYVDAEGVTRFRLPGTALPTVAIFTDDDTDGALHYIDIGAGYDTRTTVNRLEVTNYGVGPDGNENNEDLVRGDAVSMDAYGVLSENLDVNLYGEAPYESALEDRLSQILEDHAEPTLLVSSIVWNAQEDLTQAARFDVGDRVLVSFRGRVQDSQIIKITHDLKPSRWLITFDLLRLG